MDRNDLILQLAQLLQNNVPKSSVSEMPCKDCVSNPITDNHKPKLKDLQKYLNNRLELANVDTDKAVFFLLIPYSNCQWKVFVADANKKTYAQLEDYFGIIIEKIEETEKDNKTIKKPVFRMEKFFVSR